ncbi:hypothetical protein [Schaalia sp. ZJ1691]|uniref:hypothetical protein n=1 Tax=Schaalia sp. ZJ1691 TaxID=2709404 RepID=UPI0013EDB58E|nr:hypothetical protein [Schaalia sp. ZJ1691]
MITIAISQRVCVMPEHSSASSSSLAVVFAKQLRVGHAKVHVWRYVRTPYEARTKVHETRQLLEAHELDFLERFEKRGERVRWISRAEYVPGVGASPTNDFIWLTNGSQKTELKCTTAQGSTIVKDISTAVVKALKHGVVKDIFVIDIGESSTFPKLLSQVKKYNSSRKNFSERQIRRLFLMAEDGDVFMEIQLN